MKPLIDANQARLDCNDAYSVMRESIRSEEYRRMAAWIESLTALQQATMTTCAPAKLEAAQVRLKQLLALRSAMLDPGGASNGFVID